MLEELVNVAECLCSGYRDMPCGCEGCPLWDLEEYKKDEDNYVCDYMKILKSVRDR